MNFQPQEFIDRAGHRLVIRSCVQEDAANMLKYLNKTAKETNFLLREVKETEISIEREQAFIDNNRKDERSLLLVCEHNGEIIGSASFSPVSTLSRIKHRASIGIALYEEYQGYGIGKKMLSIILQQAKKVGYSQCELEVVCTNDKAINLYKKLGFEIYGTMPNNIHYLDDTYADCYWMMKKL